jgi:hypothetical protein
VVSATKKESFKDALKVAQIAAASDADFKKNKGQGDTFIRSKKISHDPNTASMIFLALTKAAWSYRLAAENYKKSGQNLWAKLYVDKATKIMTVLTSFEAAVEAFSKSAQAPKYLTISSKGSTQGDYFLQAQQSFNEAATAFQQLGNLELVSYVRRLSAFLGVIRYESVIDGYVTHYSQWLEPYIDGAVKVPSSKDLVNTMTVDVNGNTETVYIVSFQKALDTVFHYFNTLLPKLINGYEKELAFYLTFGGKGDASTDLVIDQLRSAITLFQDMQKGFSGIYHCITDVSGKPVCVSPQKSLAQSFINCWSSEKNTTCLGADNYIGLVTNPATLDKDIIQWALFANQRYFIAQPYFKKIDDLFEKYAKHEKINDEFVVQLKQYTQVKKLLTIGQESVQLLKDLLKEGQTELTFQQFFFLHQARLYTSLGQQLQYGYRWNGTQYVKRPVSAVCIYLFLWAQGLYEQGGFTEQAEGVKALVASITNDDPTLPSTFEKWAKESAAMAVNNSTKATLTPDQRKQYFEQAFAYLFTAYKLTQNSKEKMEYAKEVLYLLSTQVMNEAEQAPQKADAQKTIVAKSQKKKLPKKGMLNVKMKDAQKNSVVNVSQPQIADYSAWLNNNQNDLNYTSLSKVMVYYRGYLFALKLLQDLKASQVETQDESYYTQVASLFLEKAQDALKEVYNDFNKLDTSSQVKEGSDFTQQMYQEKVKSFSNLIDYQKLLEVTELHLEVFKNFIAVDDAESLAWVEQDMNINERLGNLYKASADLELNNQIKNFESGQSYGMDTRDAFNDIVARYQTAVEQYAQSDNQELLIEANIGITKALAFQKFSEIIPVYNLDIQNIGLNNSTTNTQSASLLSSQCGTGIDIDTLTENYDDTVPFYLLNYKKVLIPSQIATEQKAESLINAQTEELINCAVAVYKAQLIEQSQGTLVISKYGVSNSSKKDIAADASNLTKSINQSINDFQESSSATISEGPVVDTPELTEYVALYQKQIENLVSNGVTVCGKTIKAEFKVVQEIIKEGGKTFKNYYLEIFNGPLSAIPRFSTELDTAIGRYTNGPLTLYGSSSIPLSFDDKTLMPANDQAGTTMVQDAIVKTFYADIVPQRSKIADLMKSKMYQEIDWINNPVFLNFSKKNKAAAAKIIEQRVQMDPSNYKAMHIELYNTFINLLGTYGALSNYNASQNQSAGVLDKLQAEAYTNWVAVNSAFLLGNPVSGSFNAEVQLMEEHLQQVRYYAGLLNDTDGVPLLEKAELIYIRSLSLIGDAFALTDAEPNVTYYPTNSQIFPAPVPGFDTFKQWKNAWQRYIIAKQQADNFIKTYTQSDSLDLVQNLSDIIQTKSFLAVAHLATFYFARFGYNAYRQALGVLTDDGMEKVKNKEWQTLVNGDSAYDYWMLNTKRKSNTSFLSSLQAKLNAKGDSQSDIQKQLNKSKWYDAIEIRNPVTYMKYDIEYSLADAKNYLSGSNAGQPISSERKVPFSFLPQSATSVDYQGVFSLETPEFQYILNNGIGAAGGGASFESFASGSGGIVTVNGNIAEAYSIMKEDLLHVIYFYMQAINILNPLLPQETQKTKKQLQAEQKAKHLHLKPGKIITTTKLAEQLSKAPSFGLSLDAGVLQTPVISVQSTTKGKGKAVNRFLGIANYMQPGFILKGEQISPWAYLTVASNSNIYTHTLHYWASQATFGPDIFEPLENWIDLYQENKVPNLNLGKGLHPKTTSSLNKQISPTNYLEAALDWITQFQTAARKMYWKTYLGNISTYVAASSQIDSAIKAVANKALSDASQYVG